VSSAVDTFLPPAWARSSFPGSDALDLGSSERSSRDARALPLPLATWWWPEVEEEAGMRGPRERKW